MFRLAYRCLQSLCQFQDFLALVFHQNAQLRELHPTCDDRNFLLRVHSLKFYLVLSVPFLLFSYCYVTLLPIHTLSNSLATLLRPNANLNMYKDSTIKYHRGSLINKSWTILNKAAFLKQHIFFRETHISKEKFITLLNNHKSNLFACGCHPKFEKTWSAYGIKKPTCKTWQISYSKYRRVCAERHTDFAQLTHLMFHASFCFLQIFAQT